VKSDFITVGKIVGCHGLRGVVKAFFFSGSEFDTDVSIALKKVSGEIEFFKLEQVKRSKKISLLSFKGVESRESAELLKGAGILAKRSDLPEPDDGVYYWIDLIGLDVSEEDGQRLGTLKSIIETGSADVYVVKNDAVNKDSEILIPALKSVVLKVDLNNRTMTVRLPVGLAKSNDFSRK